MPPLVTPRVEKMRCCGSPRRIWVAEISSSGTAQVVQSTASSIECPRIELIRARRADRRASCAGACRGAWRPGCPRRASAAGHGHGRPARPPEEAPSRCAGSRRRSSWRPEAVGSAHKALILDRACRARAACPVVVGRRRHAEGPADGLDPEIVTALVMNALTSVGAGRAPWRRTPRRPSESRWRAAAL